MFDRFLMGTTDLTASIGSIYSDGELPKIEGTFCGGYGSDRAKSGVFSGTWDKATDVGAGHDLPGPATDEGWIITFKADNSSIAYCRTDNKVLARWCKILNLIRYIN